MLLRLQVLRPDKRFRAEVGLADCTDATGVIEELRNGGPIRLRNAWLILQYGIPRQLSFIDEAPDCDCWHVLEREVAQAPGGRRTPDVSVFLKLAATSTS
jgi:hypothetical protein